MKEELDTVVESGLTGKKDEYPFHFQDDFLKAKRNLLWSCTVSILIFLSGVTGKKTENLVFPLTATDISRDWFMILISLYSCYLCWGFYFHQKRQEFFNTGGIYDNDFQSIDTALSKAREAITDKALEFQIAIENIQEKDFEEIFKRKDEINDNLKGLLSSLDYQKNLLPATDKAELLKLTCREGYPVEETDWQKLHLAIMKLKKVVDEYDKESAANKLVIDLDVSRLADIMKKIDTMMARIEDQDARSKLLQRPIDDLHKLRVQFSKFDSSIKETDKTKLIYLDLVPAYGMFILSIILAFTHFVLKYWPITGSGSV